MTIFKHSVRAAVFMVVAASAATFSSSAGFAQSTAPSAQDINPIQRITPPEARDQNRGDILSPPPPGPCPDALVKSQSSFTITGVQFDGADAISMADLGGAYSGMVGHPIRPGAICEIRDRAADILFRRGILARVEIPPQRISGQTAGPLHLTVIEAYVAAIDVHGDDTASDKVAEYIEKLRGMKPFDINKAQRYLLLAADVPGVHITATLKPSPLGRGAIALDITVTRTPYNALVNVQNFGSEAVGPFGFLGRVDLNSFTPLGERSTLVGYMTADPREQWVIQGVEEARIGDNGLLGHLSLAYGETHPGGALSVLDLAGSSLVGEVSLSYPLIRSRAFNTNLSAGFDIVQQNVNVGGSSPLSRDQLRVFSASLVSSYAWHDLVPGSFNFSTELRQGINGLGASNKGDALLSRVEGDPSAFEVRSGGQLLLQWTPVFSSYMSYQAQWTDKPLLAYEELAVGNLTIGRGYDPSVVSGDRGTMGSFELRLGQFPMMRDRADFHFGVMGFFDIADIHNLDTGGLNRTLKSAGMGMNFQLGRNVHLDLLYAKPLDTIASTVAVPPGDRVFMNLSYAL